MYSLLQRNLLTVDNAGFNLPNVLQTVQNLTQAYMNAQQSNYSVGGRSLIALMLPFSTVQVSSSDSSYATTQLQYIYEQIPDLHFIYYASGQISRFATFVRNPSQDLFTLNTGSTASASSGPVVSRIVQSKFISCSLHFIHSLNAHWQLYFFPSLASCCSSTTYHQSTLRFQLDNTLLGHRSNGAVSQSKWHELLSHGTKLLLRPRQQSQCSHTINQRHPVHHMYLTHCYATNPK